MAAAAPDGQENLEASVSSKLFNSGRALGSFLDVGNNSESSVPPPIDVEDDANTSQARHASSSGLKAASSVGSDAPAARTPRALQASSADHNKDVVLEYPPSSSQTSNSTPTSAFSASKHPQLLPHFYQQSSLDPSTSSNNSSGQSSFDYNRGPSARTAVIHPSASQNNGGGLAGPLSDSSTGLLPPNHGGESSSYIHDRKDEDDHISGFAKVSAGKKSMQVFGTPPVGIIGVHKPREILRLDRDYTSGEICQFWSGFPLELEGRITATQHLNVMNELNAILASAFDPYKAIFDNVVAVLSLYISTWLLSSHYDKEIARFDKALEEANRTLYNPAGLNLINPKKNGYLFLELEYY